MYVDFLFSSPNFSSHTHTHDSNSTTTVHIKIHRLHLVNILGKKNFHNLKKYLALVSVKPVGVV